MQFLLNLNYNAIFLASIARRAMILVDKSARWSETRSNLERKPSTAPTEPRDGHSGAIRLASEILNPLGSIPFVLTSNHFPRCHHFPHTFDSTYSIEISLFLSVKQFASTCVDNFSIQKCTMFVYVGEEKRIRYVTHIERRARKRFFRNRSSQAIKFD